MVVRSRWIWQMRNHVKQNGQFLGVFCGFLYFLSIFRNFWPKYYTWFESSGNDDSNATFPKSLRDTSKHTDFCHGGGKVVWLILPILCLLNRIAIILIRTLIKDINGWSISNVISHHFTVWKNITDILNLNF